MIFSPDWCPSDAPITTLPTYAEWLIFLVLPLLAPAIVGARCEVDSWRGAAKGLWFGFIALLFVAMGLFLQAMQNWFGGGVQVGVIEVHGRDCPVHVYPFVDGMIIALIMAVSATLVAIALAWKFADLGERIREEP